MSYMETVAQSPSYAFVAFGDFPIFDTAEERKKEYFNSPDWRNLYATPQKSHKTVLMCVRNNCHILQEMQRN